MNDLPIKLYRAWINQPLASQTYHRLHGQHVLVYQQGSNTRIYFLKGDVISQLIDPLALSKGWPPVQVAKESFAGIDDFRGFPHWNRGYTTDDNNCSTENLLRLKIDDVPF